MAPSGGLLPPRDWIKLPFFRSAKSGRIVMYGVSLPGLDLMDNRLLIAVAVLSACGGAWLGNQLLTKVTLRSVQILVTVMLLAIAAALGSGLI